MFTWSDRTGRLAGTAVTRRLGWGEIIRLTQPTEPPPLLERGTPAQTLMHELAVEELDLLDLALALEVDFSVVASELRSGKVRTYGELTEALLALTRSRVRGGSGSADGVPFVWARVVSGKGTGGVVHAGALSNEAVRTIEAAALAGGRGTTVEITVAAPAVDRRGPHAEASARWITADALGAVEARFASLAARGIVVTIQPHEDADTRAPERPRKPRASWWNSHRPSQQRPQPRLATAKVAVVS